MSYAFTKCIEAQAAFECAEELFVKFLSSLISALIEPFTHSLSKFNLSQTDIEHLHSLFEHITDLHSFHYQSRLKLDTPPSQSSTHSQGHTLDISPPARHHRHTSSNSQFQQNLNAFVFKYYANLPQIYRKFFDSSLTALPHLSEIITAQTSLKKWFRSKCDDLTLLYDNTKPYSSLAQILGDILSHGRDQSAKLQNIAKSKYLTNSTDARAFKENMRTHLAHVFMNKWSEEHKGKFDLLHMELSLTQTNTRLYATDRQLMLTFNIDLPTKARSVKNLMGLNKNKVAQQTQEGIFYIFNNLLLICTKELKFKGCYPLFPLDFAVDSEKKTLTFHTQNTNENKRKVTVFMRKAEELKMALDAIREYQMHLKHRWSQRELQKINVSTNGLIRNSKKSPPISIPIHGHAHTKHYTSNAIQKSNSFPSQLSSRSKMTASPSMTQLEANTQYNRGRTNNNRNGQRASMKSNGTNNSHLTYSLLTETTGFNDISEPRTSNAFSVQTGTMATPIVQVMTPVSDTKSDDSHSEHSMVIHPSDTTHQATETALESDEDTQLNETEKREKFKLYRSENLRDGRRFSVPSMLSSIASSGKGSTDSTDEISKEPSPNYRGINLLDVSDSDTNNDKSPMKFNAHKLRQRSKSMLSKQVRFKNNNSNNSFTLDSNIKILTEERDIIIDFSHGNSAVPNDINDLSHFGHLDGDIPIYDEEDILGKDEMANLSEEEYLMEEHNEKLIERQKMDNIDIDKEDTPSIDLADDPHDLHKVEFIDADYTSDDDHSFKMKLLHKPKWGIDDEPGQVRDYPMLPAQDYYKLRKDILDNVKYSQNMHSFKVQIRAQVKAKVDSIRNDDTITKWKKEKMIAQMNAETELQIKASVNNVPRHPFERFLDEMHEYEHGHHTYAIDSNKDTGKKHKRYDSAELLLWDDNGDEINDENNYLNLDVIQGSKPGLKATQLSNGSHSKNSKSSANQSLSLPNVDSHNLKKPRLNSMSSLGPSPSELHISDMSDDGNNGKECATMQAVSATQAIQYTVASPTQNVLERFNLQTNNALLLCELRRLRSIIASQSEEMASMEGEIERLNENLSDKEVQTKALRSTNRSLKSCNKEWEDRLKQSSEMCAELKKDNSRLNQLVHDSCMSVMDYDDDDSQKSGSICLPQQPPMKASKSDVSPSLRQFQIAPELVNHVRSNYKKEKFDSYTQMRNGRNSGAHKQKQKKTKTKTKTFHSRPKYHSFALGQAKREHMTRNRAKKSKEREIDHLSSVKNRLLGLKMSGLKMPQSMTQITPQHSCTHTPRKNGYGPRQKLSDKSLISATSSNSICTDPSSDGNPLLPMYNVSAPTFGDTFGSPMGSPSPRPNQPTSPVGNFGQATVVTVDRPRMIDIKGKSYDNIHRVPYHKGSLESVGSPVTSPIANHKRRDTPTPNFSKLSKNNKFVYTKLGADESINPSQNGMLLGNSECALEQIQSVPNSAASSLSNLKRISFTSHHKMHFVEDDDHSDVSITNKSFQSIAHSRLPKRRITYTKSANTLFKSSQNSYSNSHSNMHTRHTDIPSYFSRGHSQSFSVQKSRQHRSGSVSAMAKSSYHSPMGGLKDRTRKNRPSNIKAKNAKSLPSQQLYTPKTPHIIRSHPITHNRDANQTNNTNRNAYPKRRSVNFTPTIAHSLKPKPSQRHSNYISKSPNFIPKSTPSSYPNTFSGFTLK